MKLLTKILNKLQSCRVSGNDHKKRRQQRGVELGVQRRLKCVDVLLSYQEREFLGILLHNMEAASGVRMGYGSA